jgi:acetylornithine deacetylase/succinyl-diaminopimelate desuccinylase-like protein
MRISVSSREVSSLLERLVGCDSPSGAEQSVISELRTILRDFGIPFRLQRVDSRANIVSSLPDHRGNNLVLCSHLDTVPRAGSRAPAVPITDGQVVRGLGACDAKGSLVSMIVAFRSLQDSGDGRGVGIAFLVGEEESGDGGLVFVRGRRRPRYAIVGEPTQLTLPWAQAGYVHLELNSSGNPRHAFSRHGPDAMRTLLAAIRAIEEVVVRKGDALPEDERPSVFLEWVEGGSRDRFWYLRHSATAGMVVNVHPSWDVKTFVSEVRAACKSSGRAGENSSLSIRVRSWDPGFELGPHHLRDAVERALQSHSLPNPRTYMRSWTDAATLAWEGISTVVIGPGSLDHAHSPGEEVAIRDVELAASLYASAAISVDRWELTA